MHEMGIAMEIVKISRDSIPPHMTDARVERVNVRIGKLSAVVPQSLRFCFEMAVKDTPLDGAELAIEEVPVVAQCRDCHHSWTITGPAFFCEKCKSGKVDLLSGQELDIVSIELE